LRDALTVLSVVREIEHADCVKLADAGALSIAMAIDPERVAERSGTQETKSAGSPPAAGSDQAADQASAAPRPDSGPERESAQSRRSDRGSFAAVLRWLRPGASAITGGGVLPG
jgi:hypothetical protein